MKNKSLMINIVGGLFFILGTIAITNTSFWYGPQHILWFCYWGLAIMGIGFLKRNHVLIESQLNILTIPLIVWAFDFIYYILFGHSLLNIVSYFFEPGPILAKIITSQHLFTIPLALYTIRFIKPKSKNSLKFSMLMIFILFILSRLLTNYEHNINWVYHTSLNLGIPYYPLFWFGIMFVIIYLTNFLLKKFQLKFKS